jgi:hypothetical protein
MKKDLVTHFSFMIAIFILISLFKDWIDLAFLPFWFGGILGTLIPDFDHLIYVYFLSPNESTSVRVAGLLEKREVLKSWDILSETRRERKDLLFHSVHFQLLFTIFAFFIITSTVSLLAKGLVLAFLVHLLIDQVIDLMDTGSLDNWFLRFQINLDAEQKRWYLVANALVLLVITFFL